MGKGRECGVWSVTDEMVISNVRRAHSFICKEERRAFVRQVILTTRRGGAFGADKKPLGINMPARKDPSYRTQCALEKSASLFWFKDMVTATLPSDCNRGLSKQARSVRNTY